MSTIHGTSLLRRHVSLLVAFTLATLGAVVIYAPRASAAGAPGIVLSKQAPSSVLAGQAVRFTLTASNPSSNTSAVPEYNTSFRDVLPVGVSYQPGSTTPTDVGEPTIVTNAGQQTLIWPDTFDLQVAASASITFSATVDSTVLPVASTILNTGNAYASTAPRFVPKFSATGTPIADARVQAATSNQTGTSVTALSISKAESSPESKLLRGVHDHPTVYTLTVTDTAKAATNAVTVIDYLPASEEFLGCGEVDNSAGVEYPGAPSLSATPIVGSNCPTPASVDTVGNPPANGSVVYPAGIYTKVTWNLGTLAAGQVVTIKYAAGIPLRQNVLFVGGPSAASLGQSANLDNNTGPSTRQVGDAAAQVNYAHAAGTYTGPVAAGSPAVVADTSQQVSANDLRIYKSVAEPEFVAGNISHYTLHVDSSEYVDNSGITITDTLPNGVCPLDDVANRVTGAPAECNSGAGFAPSLPYQSVTQNADGSFTVVFQPTAVAKDGGTVITYQARGRLNYTGGALAGNPPAAGDSFVNSASEQGSATAVAATGFTGTQTVTDATSATQTTSFGALSKTVGARATPMNCATATYGTTNPVFVKGDRVCFQISIPFSTANQTRNAVVTDFLPVNLSYEAGSIDYPAANTVDPAQIGFDTAGAATGQLTWTVGAPQPDGSTEVPAGTTLVARFSATVDDAAPGPAPDKPGNIVKLRTTNSDGVANSLRDGVDFQIAAAPPIGLSKGVASVNGSTPVNPANTDHVAVREGDSVVFRIDATNTGTAADGNNVDVSNLQLWDVLPAGIRCAQISASSDAGACTNPGDAGQPAFTGNGNLSAIVWTGAAVAALPAGIAKTYTYAVTIPSGVSVSSNLSNRAAIRSYTTTTDIVATPATYFPAANIDTSVPTAQYDAPAASDVSDVYLRDAIVSKGVVSAINAPGNIGAEGAPTSNTKATIGEQVTFTTSAIVPAHSTVYNASFTDPVPTGLTLNSATATYRPDSGSVTTAAVPAGITFSASSPPTVAFPASYDNTTGTDQVFTMTIVETLAQFAGNQNGVTRTNTATFASQTAATGGTNLPARTAAATVTDVEPSVGLTKTNNAGGPAAGGQTITYTLKPSNPAGRPALHDAWQLDCLPNGLSFAAYGAIPGGVSTAPAVAGDGSNGCPANYTVLSWNLGDLAGGSTLTLTYTVTVDPAASGKSSFVNVAAVSGNSLAGVRSSPTDPGNAAGRQYSAAANSTVNIAGATALKSVTPSAAAVGDTVTYSTSAVLPAGVNFYSLSLIDQVPNGIDPNSIVQGAVSCTNADSTACGLTSATPLTPVAGPSSSTIIGWLVGDAAAAAQSRTITVKYSAKVKDNAAAVAGATLVNQLHIAWNTSAGTAPTSAGTAFNQTSPTVTATVAVLEPNLSIVKSVNNLTPEPGQSFSYLLSVTNPNSSSIGPAYNVTITDTVPTGVIVDPASISGGTISGQTANGGGTINWSLASPLAKNSSTSLTYSAKLAPSASLGAAGLTNAARVTGYDSLPSAGRHYTGGSAQATVTPRFPKVSTVKSMPAGGTAYIGESFAWKITVTDSGAGAAYQVGCVDTLPVNWTYDVNTAHVIVNGVDAGQVEPSISSSGGVQTLTWTALGNLPVGTNLTINFTSTPQPGVTGAPGVGIAVNQTNTATSTAQDGTGATGNSVGPYLVGAGTATARIASADLSLTKVVGIAPVAGNGATFTLSVRNAGPDTATGPFSVTDQFNNPTPSGISNVVASGAGWSCQTAAPLSCQRSAAGDTLPSGASFPAITVSYNVASAVPAGTSLPNTAQVIAHTFDPALANNTGTVTAIVSATADITISKSVSSAAFIAGAPVSYALVVTNTGPSDAAGPITIDDPLPAGTTFVSAAGAGWTCDPIAVGTIGATVHCSQPGPLGVGATPPAVSVTVGIPSSQLSPVINTASVGDPTTDPTPANNTSTVTNTPATLADLSIQKRHLSATFVAGQSAQYRIDVHNTGESDAATVQVVDNLPTGLSYASFSSTDPNWDCAAAGSKITCDYTGALNAGTTTGITVTVNLASNFVSPAANTATVTSSTTDPVPGNNIDTDTSTVGALADLSIVKTDSGTATAGTGLNFFLAVHNNGPSDVPGTVTVSDSLPVGLSFGTATGTGWVCNYASGSRLITCTLAGGLTSGTDAAAITVATTVNSDVGGSVITNVASVASDTTDPALSNNSSTDPVNIVTSADISLTKVLSGTSPVLAGTDTTFVLSTSNAGPSDAMGVSVTDMLPAYLSFDSFSGSGWDCIATGQDVVCTRDTIAAHTSAPDITLTVLVSASTPVSLPAGTATLQNNATASSATHDPTPADNTPAAVDVPVLAKADLSLTKTPKGGTVGAGSTYEWNLAVHNDGPSDAAAAITVTDVLPSYQSYLSATAAWTCTATAAPGTPTDHQSVTCTLNQSLAAGSDAPLLTLLVQLDAATPAGVETNSATASSPTPGVNGSDSAPVTVSRTAVLSITKVHNGNGMVGKDLPFTLGVHNAGPSMADQLVITDPLPAGLSYVSGTGTGWTCTADAANKVRCVLAGTVAVGADSPALTLTTTVAANAYPGVTNIATVSSDDLTLPGAATASDPVIVEPDAQLTISKKHVGSLVVASTGTYQIAVANGGSTANPGPITVVDTLPDGLSYQGESAADWSCTVVGQIVTCTDTTSLAVAATSLLTLTVKVAAAAYPAVVNTATVQGPGSAAATATDRAPVTPTVMLTVVKSLASYRAGLATYRIAATDQGPSDTTDPVTITDPLPTGLSFVSATGTGWSCSVASNVVRCVHPSMITAGSASAVTVLATVSASVGSVIDNVASAGGGQARSVTDVPSNKVTIKVTAVGGTSAVHEEVLAATGQNLRLPIEAAVSMLLAGLLLAFLSRRRTNS